MKYIKIIGLLLCFVLWPAIFNSARSENLRKSNHQALSFIKQGIPVTQNNDPDQPIEEREDEKDDAKEKETENFRKVRSNHQPGFYTSEIPSSFIAQLIFFQWHQPSGCIEDINLKGYGIPLFLSTGNLRV